MDEEKYASPSIKRSLKRAFDDVVDIASYPFQTMARMFKPRKRARSTITSYRNRARTSKGRGTIAKKFYNRFSGNVTGFKAPRSLPEDIPVQRSYRVTGTQIIVNNAGPCVNYSFNLQNFLTPDQLTSAKAEWENFRIVKIDFKYYPIYDNPRGVVVYKTSDMSKQEYHNPLVIGMYEVNSAQVAAGELFLSMMDAYDSNATQFDARRQFKTSWAPEVLSGHVYTKCPWLSITHGLPGVGGDGTQISHFGLRLVFETPPMMPANTEIMHYRWEAIGHIQFKN